MSGINFTGASPLNRVAYSFLDTAVPYAAFGQPPATLLDITIPEAIGGNYTARGALFFGVGIGGLNLIVGNDPMQCTILATSTSGGVLNLAFDVIPQNIPFPAANFGGLTVIQFEFRAALATPISDVIIRFSGVENAPGTLGALGAGSYIEVLQWQL